jgi:hypothetical protein
MQEKTTEQIIKQMKKSKQEAETEAKVRRAQLEALRPKRTMIENKAVSEFSTEAKHLRESALEAQKALDARALALYESVYGEDGDQEEAWD